jgi:putative transposase
VQVETSFRLAFQRLRQQSHDAIFTARNSPFPTGTRHVANPASAVTNATKGDAEAREAELFEQIGRLKMELVHGRSVHRAVGVGWVAVSMDGRGRALDNVFVERLWRAVKYENIYIRGYKEVSELRRGLSPYFGFYNHARLHQALAYRTPASVDQAPVPFEDAGRLSRAAGKG